MQKELPQSLSLLDATMINIGSMIGSGIFIVPASVALYLDSSLLIIGVWIFGGIISLCGALSIAELGAMMPKAGGQYVYLSKAYHPLFGFLYGWTNFAVIMTGSIAAVAVGFATYLGHFVSLNPIEIKTVAMLSILLLTVINCLSTRFGAMFQNGFTTVKMLCLGGLIILPFISNGGSWSHFSPAFSHHSFTELIAPLGLSIVAVLWAYDGWIEITYVAGEVIEPQKNLPRSLILSTLAMIGLYTLINVAYIYVLSPAGMSKAPMVASEAAIIVLGTGGASLVAISVMIAMFGANNGFVFTGARIYYAMAKERLFFRPVKRIHPTFDTPYISLIAQGAWACALIFTGTFEQLFTYVVFASWLFYAMSCGAVLILRQKAADLPRLYRTWGYPWTPVAFILFSLFLVINTLIEDPRDALIGLGIILMGVPLYVYWSRNSLTEAAEDPSIE
ncbi:amino acid permease [bacterium]|nr:amino acid permease [bacterium]